MINNLETFHCYVGKIMMFCQCIENDIRWIYSGIKKGDINKTLNELEENKVTLGNMLRMLKTLDNSDSKPYLNKNDYDLLSKITNIRNFWAHKGYTEFVYKNNKEWYQSFSVTARKLENDYNLLNKLTLSIQEVRLDVLKMYNRF